MFDRRGWWHPASCCSAIILLVSLVVVGVRAPLSAQAYDRIDRARARSMFNQIRDEVKKTYYDPTFHGIDIDEHFRRASDKLDQADSYNQAITVIAQALTDLDDSHTYFDPPSRSSAVDYGWRHKMIGNECYVTAVKPGSDAEAKGLRPGDRVILVEGLRPTRDTLWKIDYFFYILNHRAALHIVAETQGAEPRQMDIAATIRQFPRTLDGSTPQAIVDLLAELDNGPLSDRFREKNGVVIWKMTTFDLTPEDIDDIMRRKVGNAKSLILDLRGNGGGYAAALERLVSHFFDHEIRIADLKGRKKMDPAVAKKRRGRPFSGKVIVLIDSQSASASEMFARVMQIEKRAVVIGDRSEGAVMLSRVFQGKMGVDSLILFSASITDANLIMADGKSLERVGVEPDELLRPTSHDLAAGCDPVLARAVELAGERITADTAGKLFPIEWRQ